MPEVSRVAWATVGGVRSRKRGRLDLDPTTEDEAMEDGSLVRSGNEVRRSGSSRASCNPGEGSVDAGEEGSCSSSEDGGSNSWEALAEVNCLQLSPA